MLRSGKQKIAQRALRRSMKRRQTTREATFNAFVKQGEEMLERLQAYLQISEHDDTYRNTTVN